jgi:hypothetical protein
MGEGILEAECSLCKSLREGFQWRDNNCIEWSRTEGGGKMSSKNLRISCPT